MDESRRHIWSELDYSVVDRSTINESLAEHFQATQELCKLLLIDFSGALNNIHHSSHADRYWNIIIGPWLKSFCNALMFRWVHLTSARSVFDTDGSALTIDNNLGNVHPRNFSEYRKCITTDTWSQHIYSMIWNSLDTAPNSIGRDAFHQSKQPTSVSSVQQISRNTKTASRRVVIVDSYLPRRSEISLRFLVGSPRLKIPRIDAPLISNEPAVRKTMMFENPAVNQLHQISRNLVIDQLPSVYVEGYRLLVEYGAKLKLPISPSAVFTANRHFYDDVFNTWVAQATENGSSYFIGQHGGYYGSSRFRSDAEIHEEQVSDTHLTWGWKYTEKQLPGPCLKTVGRSYRPTSKAKHLLIVSDQMWKHPRSLFHEISENVGYLDYLIGCINGLSTKIREDIIIRLHHAHDETGSSQFEWWQIHAPQIPVDDGRSRLKNLIRKSRVVVSTSNGATYLETLNLNIPTLITWNDSYVQLRPEALPYFQRLEEAGIFHGNDQSFVDHLTKHWDDIESWWASDTVQSARLMFCNQFSRIQPHPLMFLRHALNSGSMKK